MLRFGVGVLRFGVGVGAHAIEHAAVGVLFQWLVKPTGLAFLGRPI